MTDRHDRDGSSVPDDQSGGDDRTMADVSHVNPDTSETFWTMYRRGPAMADGGEEPPRPGADDRHGRTRRNGSGRPDGTDESMADVSHEPPYPEANDVWTRGFKRPSDVGSDE